MISVSGFPHIFRTIMTILDLAFHSGFSHFKQQKLSCNYSENCFINAKTRKDCTKCRLIKCFKVGMRSDVIGSATTEKLRKQLLVENTSSSSSSAISSNHHPLHESEFQAAQHQLQESPAQYNNRPVPIGGHLPYRYPNTATQSAGPQRIPSNLIHHFSNYRLPHHDKQREHVECHSHPLQRPEETFRNPATPIDQLPIVVPFKHHNPDFRADFPANKAMTMRSSVERVTERTGDIVLEEYAVSKKKQQQQQQLTVAKSDRAPARRSPTFTVASYSSTSPPSREPVIPRHIKTDFCYIAKLNEDESNQMLQVKDVAAAMRAKVFISEPSSLKPLVAAMKLQKFGVDKMIVGVSNLMRFKMLDEKLKETLLRGSCTEMMLCRSTMHFCPEAKGWTVQAVNASSFMPGEVERPESLKTWCQTHVFSESGTALDTMSFNLSIEMFQELNGNPDWIQDYYTFCSLLDQSWKEDEILITIFIILILYNPEHVNCEETAKDIK